MSSLPLRPKKKVCNGGGEFPMKNVGSFWNSNVFCRGCASDFWHNQLYYLLHLSWTLNHLTFPLFSSSFLPLPFSSLLPSLPSKPQQTWCQVYWHRPTEKVQIWNKESSSQVSSIDTALALGARGCEFESRQCQCSRENWVCLKSPWTRNSLLIVS